VPDRGKPDTTVIGRPRRSRRRSEPGVIEGCETGARRL